MRTRQRLLDHRHAVLAAEPQVGEHEVHMLAFQNIQRTRDVGSHIHIERIFQRITQPFTGVFFVVNNEDGGLHSAGDVAAPALSRKRQSHSCTWQMERHPR